MLISFSREAECNRSIVHTKNNVDVMAAEKNLSVPLKDPEKLSSLLYRNDVFLNTPVP